MAFHLTGFLRNIHRTYSSFNVNYIGGLNRLISTHESNLHQMSQLISYILKNPTLAYSEQEGIDRYNDVTNIKHAYTIIFDTDSFFEMYWAMQMLQTDNVQMFTVLTQLKSNPRFTTMIDTNKSCDFLKDLIIDSRTRSYIDQVNYSETDADRDSNADVKQILFMITYLFEGVRFNECVSSLVSYLCSAACYAEYRFSLEEIKMFIREIGRHYRLRSFNKLDMCFRKENIIVAEAMVDFFIAEDADTSNNVYNTAFAMIIADVGYDDNPFHGQLVAMLCRKNLVPERRQILNLLMYSCKNIASGTEAYRHDDLCEKLVATLRILMNSYPEINYHFVVYNTIFVRLRLFADITNTSISSVLSSYKSALKYIIGDLSPDYCESTVYGVKKYGMDYDPVIHDFLTQLAYYCYRDSPFTKGHIDLLDYVLGYYKS